MNNPINNWPQEDQPREKLIKNGEHTLSNSELLAIILRTGSKGQSAIDIARKILDKFKNFRNMSHTDLSHWKEFKGLGRAKLAQIKASLEIGRRFREEETKDNRQKITSAKDVAKILTPRMRDLKKEVFKILLLNSQNQIIDIVEIESGSVNQAYPIIREVFQKALQEFSAFIICAHNHPSGNPLPSPEDEKFTQEMIQAGKILQIETLDHIIIGDNCYFSFSEKKRRII
ncbi:MAG: DNA repair protein RadC [Candidatus Omnitrophica bacterium]|nr:DNA repair protein RadC [Candidatus Omnitrophota bacterium]